MSNTKTTTLYQKICALLKVGNEGKLKSFLDRTVKNLRRSIDSNMQSISVLQFELEKLTSKYQDTVEDLTQAIEDAYTGVDLERIQTNADAEAYMNPWLQTINKAERALESAEKEYEVGKKTYTDQIEELEKQNEKLEIRISRIVG